MKVIVVVVARLVSNLSSSDYVVLLFVRRVNCSLVHMTDFWFHAQNNFFFILF